MTWLLTTLAALAAAFYIAAPFYRESALAAPAGAPLRARQRELESQREGLLREIKELELDRRMGKVDAEQYAATRARATREAALVLRQIEALQAPQASPSAARVARAPRLEKSALRPSGARRARLESEIEIEVAVARARKMAKAASRWNCSCGRVMAASDRFCAACGQPRPMASELALAQEQAVA